MRYAVFNFLPIVYFTKCASQYLTENILTCGQLRYKGTDFGGVESTNKMDTFHINNRSLHVHLLSSVITAVSISAFCHSSAVFCTFISYQSEWFHTQHTMKGGSTPYSLKCRQCPITFYNYKCLNISPFLNSAVFIHSYVINSNELLHADGGLFFHPTM